jgi:hypothetical protein
MSSGPALALCAAIQNFFLSFTSSLRGRHLVKLACRLGLFWMKYADHLLQNRPAAYDGAYAFFFIGRKADRRISETELLRGYEGNTPNLLDGNWNDP